MTQAPVYDDRELDRTPPQDLAAEQSVLGAMMMSKDAISVISSMPKKFPLFCDVGAGGTFAPLVSSTPFAFNGLCGDAPNAFLFQAQED